MEFNDIELLREYRKKKELTYPQIGKALGVTSITVFHWIKGDRKPSPMARKLIRQYLEERLD